MASMTGNGTAPYNPPKAIVGSMGLQSIKTGDLNGDGPTDLVGTSADGTTVVAVLGKGGGSFGDAVLTRGAPGLITPLADFNRGGKPDLVAAEGVMAGKGGVGSRFSGFVGG